MKNEAETFIDSIYEKLKKINSKNINLNKNELKEFVLFLIKNN